MLPRVFISSIMEGFAAFRSAARAAVLDSGAYPVLVEDFPALDVSPRTACLDAVASCDIVLAIVGPRGGWTAPSGKPVVEEEFDEAVRTSRRTAVFVQECGRDPAGQRLVDKLSNYVDGRFRLTFRTPDDLAAAIRSTLPPLLEQLGPAISEPGTMRDEFARPFVLNDETTVRTILQPERAEELVPAEDLESPTLRTALFEAGHTGEKPLFSYERGKNFSVGITEVVILQEGGEDWRSGRQMARVELRTSGTLIVDANATGRQPRATPGLVEHLRVVDQDVAEQIHTALLFTSQLYDRLDPYKRFDRFYFNSALAGLGYRTFGPPLSQTGRGIPMGQHGDQAVVAFDSAKLMTREDLRAPEMQVSAALALFRRRLG